MVVFKISFGFFESNVSSMGFLILSHENVDIDSSEVYILAQKI